MVVGAPQSYNFTEKKPGFSKTIELCLNFHMDFRINQYYQIIIKSVHKNNFISTT